ncbi:MAG: hemerythrin domain-containing protein [Motiliproteus sp.]
MKQIISDLHQDHQHIGALLAILKNKLATLELGSRPNFNLMLDVLDYLDDYANRHHHHHEDQIFSFIRQHQRGADSLLAQTEKEHRELSQLTRALRDSVEQVLLDQPFLIEDFSQRLRRFIDKQIRHLSFEERQLLPLIDRLMAESDWPPSAQLAPQLQAPLLEAAREERYQQLCSALIEDLV